MSSSFLLVVGSCLFDTSISRSMKFNCVQLIEFIIQHPNAEKNCLLCSLMSAIKTSGASNFMNDAL